jgi:ATP-dependent DNA helicase RecG
MHGKQSAKEKERVMRSFTSGETDVLVSTTVIEVGVDVPNASLMIIENAERFGLSQLHQLRGRVGRGADRSYCILVSDHDSPEVKARLGILCSTGDGFKIAEEDLRLRGPGDFFGERQHGLPEMHIADLGADILLLQKAHDEAIALLEEDPLLEKEENRILKEQIGFLLRKNTMIN